MKKLSFIFMLFLAVNGYAQESKFKEIDGYGLLSEKGCSYKTKYGKTGVELGSNICVHVYKTDIEDLDKAYEEYIKKNEYKELFAKLPKKAPEKQKDKNKIHIRISYRGVDYNILFEKKDDGIYVYDHTMLWLPYELVGRDKPVYSDDKIKVYSGRSLQVGKDYINTVSNVLVKNVYVAFENNDFYEFEVNTTSMEEAYKYIRKYFVQDSGYGYGDEVINDYFPETLSSNKATEKISDDYVTTELGIGEVDVSVLELKRNGNMIYGATSVAQP